MTLAGRLDISCGFRNDKRLGFVTADIDIYRAVKLYIDQHGDQAALQAAMRSDALLVAGDMDGAATWRKIIKALEVMQATDPVGMTH